MAATDTEARALREKGMVAFVSVLASILLTGVKLVTGLLSGSLGLLSEAVHSALDLIATVVTLFAVRASSRPADREHPYGHGKIENLAALFETLLLFVTCGWIISEAAKRLFSKTVHVDADVWTFLAVAISIVVDFWRSRALSRAARRHRSQALEADALHFSTDIWSSAVVLLGLILVRVADATGLTFLVRADAIAALGVAAIVVKVSINLGRRAACELIDTISPALREEIKQAMYVDGVLEVRQVRLRRSGAGLFVDAAVMADRGASFERAHRIAAGAEESVRVLHPEADVLVRVEPSPFIADVRSDAVRPAAILPEIHLGGSRMTRGFSARMDP